MSALPILLGCGSVRTADNGDTSLENAVSYYIDGDLESAEALLTRIVQQPASDEDLQTAYLYLGRIYMARGDYERAASAFSSGKLAGGDIRFDEYFELASTRSGVSAAKIARQRTVTRAQMAVLIHTMFGGALDTTRQATSNTPPDTARTGDEKRHWAAVSIEAVMRAGVMDMLPDGRFYPEERVTKPSFFVTAARVAAALGLAPGVVEEIVAGGYRGSLPSAEPDAAGAGDVLYIGGREVVDGLERIASAAGL